MGVIDPVIKLVDPSSKKECALSLAPSISWSQTVGTAPHVENFRLIEPRALAFVEGMKGPVELHFGGVIYKGLFITRILKSDPAHVFIRVADIRTRLDYYLHNGRYNIRRASGDLFTIVQDTAGAAVATGSRDRYVYWSMNNGVPWTALQLAHRILAVFLAYFRIDMVGQIAGYNPLVILDCDDNGYVPQDIDLTGDKVVSSLRTMLSRADREITVTRDGNIKIYNPRTRIIAPKNVAPISGALSQPDLSRIRPKETVVYFIKERERLIKNSPSNRTISLRPNLPPLATDLYATNVCRIPFKATINGKDYPAGSWVSHESVVSYLASDAAGTDRLWDFTGEASILKAVALGGNFFIELWSRGDDDAAQALGLPNQRKTAWSQAILDSFARYWQIASDVFMHVFSWAPETTAYLDGNLGPKDIGRTNTWTKRPSPVYTEWTDEWSYYYNVSAKTKRDTALQPRTSFTVTPYKTAPFMVAIHDEARGVFSIDPIQEASGYLLKRSHGQIKGIPSYVDPKTRWVEARLMSQDATITSRPRMETVLTFVEGTPNSKDGLHAIRIPAEAGVEANVPLLELFHGVERARFDKDNVLRNNFIIGDIARAEAKAALDSFIDRPVGRVSMAFDPAAQWDVSGHVTAITHICSRTQDGGISMTTMLTCADSLVPPNVLSLMPAETRAYLSREKIAVEGS